MRRFQDAFQLALTSVVVRLDGLLEGGDVPEGAQEQHHDVLFVFDGSDVKEQP